MKTAAIKPSIISERLLILFIYLVAFALMAFSFKAHANDTKSDTKQVTKKSKSGTTKANSKKEKYPKVVIKTSMGEISIELDSEKAPISTENFLKYVNEKFYDGTIFHRVIPTFMIQGGGMTPDMKEKEMHAPIKNEANNGLKNARGTVAMARTNIVDSATAQFFINTVDNSFLDYSSPEQYGYAVFGRVTKGMDVVDKIKNVETATKFPHENVPVKSVIIESIRQK